MGRVARALLSLAEAFGRDLGQGRILIRLAIRRSCCLSELLSLYYIPTPTMDETFDERCGR